MREIPALLKYDTRHTDNPHSVLLAEIRRLATLASQEGKRPTEAWLRAEEQFRTYVPENESDRRSNSKRESGEGPQFSTVYIPYSYAIAMSLHVYAMSVFTKRSPVLQYIGRSGEAETKARAVETAIAYQWEVANMAGPFAIWLLDIIKYGVGILGRRWDVQTRRVSRVVERPKTMLNIPIPGTSQKVVEWQDVEAYSGSALFNVRPLDFYIDPRVSLVDYQSGEFVFRRSHQSPNWLKNRAYEGKLFNTEHITGSGSLFDYDGRTNSRLNNLPQNGNINDRISGATFPEIVELYWEICPAKWGLSDSERPEKWAFTIADGRVIIGAEPLGWIDNRFPFEVCPFELDGYATSVRGMIELMKPFNDTIDWLFNTRFYSVRKNLNGNLIVDPSAVVMSDLTSGQHGRVVRLSPAAYGRSPNSVFSQVTTPDPTQSHFGDLNIVQQLAMRISGVSDNAQGVVQTGGRRSATETRAVNTFSTSRMEAFCNLVSIFGVKSLADGLLAYTQQGWTSDKILRVTKNPALGYQQITVTPEDIAGLFDYVPTNGTLPIDPMQQTMVWKEVIAMMSNIPTLMSQYDLGKIFAYMAEMAGAKALDQFKLEIGSEAQISQQLQAGNIVPSNTTGGALASENLRPVG